MIGKFNTNTTYLNNKQAFDTCFVQILKFLDLKIIMRAFLHNPIILFNKCGNHDCLHISFVKMTAQPLLQPRN